MNFQSTNGEDLYWEGEEDASDEFLEVKPEDVGISGRIKRHIQGFFDFLSPFTTSSTTSETPEPETSTNDPDDYVEELSRVSNEFSCKVTLDIVTAGYDNTDRITQVLQDHIRNRRKLGSIEVSDADFSAHVIDPGLVTCNEDEIRCGDDTCVDGTSRCNGFNDCFDGADEENCPNFGWDNIGQSEVSSDCVRNVTCIGTSQTICESQRCDGIVDCEQGDDETNCIDDSDSGPGRTPDFIDETTPTINTFEVTATPPPTPPPTPQPTLPPTTPVTARRADDTQQRMLPNTCPPGEFSCDETRCVSFNARCDGVADCDDESDEGGCDLSEY
ncbi:unnamed protein product [Diatraea saccharalis]|uniref:Uncharacterized protein n=1 Tax=Diatraea saccharalis TaxID=40085 RepID=A0A9N9N173_9NEOP|nr:unnamed protein product [Diatraea saccharalis]